MLCQHVESERGRRLRYSEQRPDRQHRCHQLDSAPIQPTQRHGRKQRRREEAEGASIRHSERMVLREFRPERGKTETSILRIAWMGFFAGEPERKGTE